MAVTPYENYYLQYKTIRTTDVRQDHLLDDNYAYQCRVLRVAIQPTLDSIPVIFNLDVFRVTNVSPVNDFIVFSLKPTLLALY